LLLLRLDECAAVHAITADDTAGGARAIARTRSLARAATRCGVATVWACVRARCVAVAGRHTPDTTGLPVRAAIVHAVMGRAWRRHRAYRRQRPDGTRRSARSADGRQRGDAGRLRRRAAAESRTLFPRRGAVVLRWPRLGAGHRGHPQRRTATAAGARPGA